MDPNTLNAVRRHFHGDDHEAHARQSGSVARSLPNSPASSVNWAPVSCIPSPESPAKRTTTSETCSTVFAIPNDVAERRLAGVRVNPQSLGDSPRTGSPRRP